MGVAVAASVGLSRFGPWEFFAPHGVAVSATGGDVVVCDTLNDRAQVFRADGTFVRQWGGQGAAPGQFQSPWSVAVSSTDEVFVADRGNDRIQAFRLDGSFVRSWGSRGQAPGQFWFPSGVAVHGDLVLVSDNFNHRIQCFALDGTFVRMWGSRGELYDDAPEDDNDIDDDVDDDYEEEDTFDQDVCGSYVYGAVHEEDDSEDDGDDDIDVDDDGDREEDDEDGFSDEEEGTEDRIVMPNQFCHPSGLAVASDEVFVCDNGNHRILVFDLVGTFRRGWGSYGTASGQMRCPRSVAVSSAGEVFVGDAGRVQVFLADGTFVRCLHLPTGLGDSESWAVAVTPLGDVVVCDFQTPIIYVEPAGA